jgi:hypothetical protein
MADCRLHGFGVPRNRPFSVSAGTRARIFFIYQLKIICNILAFMGGGINIMFFNHFVKNILTRLNKFDILEGRELSSAFSALNLSQVSVNRCSRLYVVILGI